MLKTDPIEAIMMALDPGVRTQAMADMEEAGCRVQTSASRGAGASHNQQYSCIYAHIKRMEWTNPEQAACIYTLYALSEEESNQWVDAFHALIVDALPAAVSGWDKLTKLKRERAGWIAFAAIVARRFDLDRTQPEWQPERISYFLADMHGVKISCQHWKRDYAQFWNAANAILERKEQESLKPVSEIISKQNAFYRQEIAKAA